MLPAATSERSSRPGPGRVNSRATEISRLIGRALRAAVDLAALGENKITIDCDVLEADGGTRVAAITGGWVALARAVRRARKDGRLPAGADPVIEQIVAISCGLVGGRPRLDLEYAEDSAAEVDMNVAATARGRLVEVQVSGEEATFSTEDLEPPAGPRPEGCRRLAKIQARAAFSRRNV